MIPVTLVMDKGTETGKMCIYHEILRCVHPLHVLLSSLHTAIFRRNDAAPDLDSNIFPHVVQVSSVHNTPIEGYWTWLREGEGRNIRIIILDGARVHEFCKTSSLHM